MKDFLQKAKIAFTSTTAKRFYWNTGNGFVGVLLVLAADLNAAFIPLAFAILNCATKEINKRLTKIDG